METASFSCVGDQPLHVVTKTRKREIVYGNSPQPAKMEQFDRFVAQCSVSRIELARKILNKSWEEKMEFLCQQFSADKEVLKVLNMARNRFDDQEPEPKRKKYFTSISRREEAKGNLEDKVTDGIEEGSLLAASSSNDEKMDKERKPEPAPEGLFYKKRTTV